MARFLSQSLARSREVSRKQPEGPELFLGQKFDWSTFMLGVRVSPYAGRGEGDAMNNLLRFTFEHPATGTFSVRMNAMPKASLCEVVSSRMETINTKWG